MYVTHRTIVKYSFAKYGMTMSKLAQTQSHVKNKPYKFDLEVKCQHRFGIMNERNTSPMVIHLYATFCKLMSKQENVKCLTDMHRRTD